MLDTQFSHVLDGQKQHTVVSYEPLVTPYIWYSPVYLI